MDSNILLNTKYGIKPSLTHAVIPRAKKCSYYLKNAKTYENHREFILLYEFLPKKTKYC